MINLHNKWENIHNFTGVCNVKNNTIYSVAEI